MGTNSVDRGEEIIGSASSSSKGGMLVRGITLKAQEDLEKRTHSVMISVADCSSSSSTLSRRPSLASLGMPTWLLQRAPNELQP